MFITFEIWIFFLQKRMDSQQEAFIHPPEPCETRFFFYGFVHFILHVLDCVTETPANCNDRA